MRRWDVCFGIGDGAKPIAVNVERRKFKKRGVARCIEATKLQFENRADHREDGSDYFVKSCSFSRTDQRAQIKTKQRWVGPLLPGLLLLYPGNQHNAVSLGGARKERHIKFFKRKVNPRFFQRERVMILLRYQLNQDLPKLHSCNVAGGGKRHTPERIEHYMPSFLIGFS